MFGVSFKKQAYPHSSTIQQIITTLVMLALLSFANATYAQVLYGSLTGTVTDASGAVVNGASVSALEVQTGLTRQATTDSSGIYRFTALSPGTYKVTITAPSFAIQETPGVLVAANEVARVDAQLRVASASQNVTVTAEAPILQTDKADVHTDLTAQQIENLPDAGSQGRNFQALLRLIPGVGLTAETTTSTPASSLPR